MIRQAKVDIHRISHICIRVRDLEKARHFYVDLLGFVETERDGDHLYLRGVEEAQHHSLVLKRGDAPGTCYIAFRVARPEELEKAINVFNEYGLRYRKFSERGVKDAVIFEDPEGMPILLYFDMEQVGDLRLKFHMYRGLPPVRLAHVNFVVNDLEREAKFYMDAFGFMETEYFLDENGQKFVTWLTRKGDSHEVAIAKGRRGPAMHHFTFYVHDVRDVIRAADIMASAGLWDSIERGPGRHGATQGFYIYLRDLDGNRLEFFTGDYLILDPDKWKPIGWTHEQARYRADFWGRATPQSWYEAFPVEDIMTGELKARE